MAALRRVIHQNPSLLPNPKPIPTLGKAAGPIPPLEHRAKPSIPFIDNMGSEMVDMFVGPEEKLYRVHKDKICKILYFDRLFNSGFQETSKKVASFAEDDCEAFDILVEWVYMSTLSRFDYLTTVPAGNIASPADSVETADPSWVLLELYTLADKYSILELQDLTMDIIRKQQREQKKLPSPLYVQKAYEKTGTSSALSRYCVSAIYYIIDSNYSQEHWPTSELETLMQELPSFASDYINLQRSTTSMDPRKGSDCQYHAHRDNEKLICFNELSPHKKQSV